MTKITFGNQYDDSSARHEIVSDGGESEIAFGNQYGRSTQTTRILDLKDPADLALLAKELSLFSQQASETQVGQAHPEDLKALNDAARRASDGDGAGAKAILKKVGSWVLSTATAVGTPVAIELLKSVIPH